MQVSDIKKVACLGGGIIGSSWAIQFAMRGLAVTLYGKTCGAAESSFVVLLSIMHTVFLVVARV